MSVEAITRAELKRRLLEEGGISPDNAVDAAVWALLEQVEAWEEFGRWCDKNLPEVPEEQPTPATTTCPLNNPKCRGAVCYKFDECEVR